jgi:ATP-dependent DNA helicase RecQ
MAIVCSVAEASIARTAGSSLRRSSPLFCAARMRASKASSSFAVKAVYRGERRVSMSRITAGAETPGRSGRARKRHSGERLGVEPADAPLFEALRAWRRERAAEQRVPPYVIFHDTTLSAIARERPASADELAKVSGAGQSKLNRYGADVLKVVRAN